MHLECRHRLGYARFPTWAHEYLEEVEVAASGGVWFAPFDEFPTMGCESEEAFWARNQECWPMVGGGSVEHKSKSEERGIVSSRGTVNGDS